MKKCLYRNLKTVCFGKSLILFSFLICLFSSSLYGQDFEKDLKAIVSRMDTSKSVSIVVKMESFQKKGGKKMYDSEGTLEKSYSNSITSIGGSTVFISSKYQVEIDKEEQTMMVLKKSQKDKSSKKEEKMKFDMKELKKLMEEENGASKPVIKLVSNNNGIKTYQMTKISGYKEIKVVLNSNLYSLVSVSYEYSANSSYKGQYIVVNYTKFDLKASFSKNYFSESKFFKVDKNTYTPSSAYKGYKLMLVGNE